MLGKETGYGPTQLPAQLQTVNGLLMQIVNGLAALQDTIRETGNTLEDQVIVAHLQTGQTYTTPVQLRLTAFKVYTSAAGLFQLKFGEDASMNFLSTVNGNVKVIDGDNEVVIVPRGVPITVVPPSGTWYATLWAKPGAVYGRQS